MKKVINLILVIIVSNISLKAQHDIKINALGLIFKNYGVGYDYAINDEMSAGIGFNYSTSFLGLETNGKYSAFNISPNFRFYTNPDDGADGFYFGGYIKYAKFTFNDLTTTVIREEGIDPYGNPAYVYEDVNYSISLTGIALGIEIGKKWVTNSGVFFETNLGFGRYLSKSTSYSSSKISDYYDEHNYTSDEEKSLNWFYTFDYRFGINIGYRFGQ